MVIQGRGPEQSSSWKDLLKVLTKANPLADLIIEVEGRQLYTSKYLLADVSKKLCQMFTERSSENSYILSSDGVTLRSVTELLAWLLPSKSLTISEENVAPLLRLAHDYDITQLRNECDRYFADKLESADEYEDFIEYILLADRYKLSKALELAISQLSRLELKELKGFKESKDISPETMYKIMEKHIEKFGKGCGANKNADLLETITLVVEDRDIEAPSSLLVAASDVFRSMITSDFLERKTGRIELPEKSYDAVKFMIDYITSQDYVPIEGEHLVDCIALADEYLLGRMKHSCSEYMMSKVEQAELNDCLLYLQLAMTYQLPEVEKKVLQVIHKKPTADIVACENYDLDFVASLMLKRAQWLETKLEKYKL